MSSLPKIILSLRDVAPNYTIPSEQCTLSTCSITQAQLTYDPSLGGNVFLATLFCLLLLLQIMLGIYYRTWTYTIGLFGGLVLEICGYIGRIQMHYNPFIQTPFFMYIISLTIGPTWLCASIYVCFSRIVVIHGRNLSRLGPKTITILFIVSDFVSLLLQAGGGAISVIADNFNFEHVGIDLMIAGLILQVVSLVIVLVLGADFAAACWRKPLDMDERYAAIRNTRYFRGFLYSLVFATIAILLRSIFRVVELFGGFHGQIWNDEVDFMVLDGTMVALASVCLTVFHPGLAFHGRWSLVKQG